MKYSMREYALARPEEKEVRPILTGCEEV